LRRAHASSRRARDVRAGATACRISARLDAGSDEGPERSATVILQVPALGGGRAIACWRGPGLAGPMRFAGGGAAGRTSLARWAREPRAVSPAGVDLILLRGGTAGVAVPLRPVSRRPEMAYVAVKGGERAIDAAHAWMAERARAIRRCRNFGLAQIREQLGRAVDRVMAEGSLLRSASSRRWRSSRRRAI
jgi:hypothetical protein